MAGQDYARHLALALGQRLFAKAGEGVVDPTVGRLYPGPGGGPVFRKDHAGIVNSSASSMLRYPLRRLYDADAGYTLFAPLSCPLENPMPEDVRPRRNVLYMPGSNARALEKGRTMADAKEAAR